MANQTMQRLKLAKFSLTKSYVSESLRQLVAKKLGPSAVRAIAQTQRRVEPIQISNPSAEALPQFVPRPFTANRFTSEQI